MSKPGIRLILRLLHDGEADLEKHLHVVADRHRTDHEVRHVAVDLARWSLENRQALAPLADRYGATLADDQEAIAGSRTVAALREKSAELLGHRSAPGLLLLHDLRELYVRASGNSTYQTMLGQAAQTISDAALLDIITTCHGRTMRQAVWCNSMIKTLSPQVLTAL